MSEDNSPQTYLIPANTKKSQYILGFFTGFDLTIFLIGVAVSFFMIVVFRGVSLGIMILMLLPGLITTFLVMPVPHYHNVLQLLTNIYNFYTNRRRYYWKGWSIYERFNDSNK